MSMDKNIISTKSQILERKRVFCFDIPNPAETSVEVSTIIANVETNCAKCSFHQAARHDERLGWLCLKCFDWFAEKQVYINLENKPDYPDLFENGASY